MLNIFQKAFMIIIMAVTSPSFANDSPTPPQIMQTQSEKVNFSPIFVDLSEIMTQVKTGDNDKAKLALANLADAFTKLPIDPSHHDLKTQVMQAFDNARASPSPDSLQSLSVALYALEKAQNPVDYRQNNAKFNKTIRPALQDLGQAIERFKTDKDLNALRIGYDNFNKTWVANERVVRNTAKSYYGKIETTMALLRVAIETQNIVNMDEQFHALQSAIDSYIKGDKPITATIDEHLDLAYGIDLLEQALNDFKQGNKANGQAKLSEFIQKWLIFEGEVSTRNPSLYSKIESQIPLIMATGDNNAQQKLTSIINELKAIDKTARYTALDSMLILLREGLEALLIVIALLTALNASGQAQGKKWVYGGVALGLFGSIAGAFALYKLFPQVASGTNRETLEGMVGIIAVVMMIGIGAWLHSKSSVKAWNSYIKNQLGKAMTTGSFFSLFLLAFLSVFREGAETILFYVGILPSIALHDFLFGIGLALVILMAVAMLLLKTSLKLPMPLLFKILTMTIYVLGFKILGVSISALQLTNYLPRTMTNLPSIELIGFYPSIQGIIAQVVYVLILIGLQLYTAKSLQNVKT